MEALGEGVVDAGGSRPCVVEGQEEGPLLDPLKIELVFDNILSNLPFKDLCSARLVSREWYQAAQPLWLDKAPRKTLYIPSLREPEDGVSSFLRKFHDPSHTYSEFEWRGVREYRSFCVEFPSEEAVPDDVDEEVLQEFITQAGARVKDLKLDFTHFSDFEMLRDILSCKFTPCLESLGIEFFKVYRAPPTRQLPPEEHRDGYQSRLKSLYLAFGRTNQEIPLHWLAHHSNLEYLTLGRFIPVRNKFPLQFAQNVLRQILQSRREDNRKFSLKELRMFGIPFDGRIACQFLVEFLQESKLPLESFDIEVGNYGDSPDLVRDLMSLLSPTLKAFSIKRAPGSKFYELRPPFMEFLREFRLDGHFFSSLALLKNFPNLRVLKLKGGEVAGPAGLIAATKDEELAEFEMKLLTEFSYELKETCSPEDFQKLKRWMPNLTMLSMRLSNETFRMTCEFWPLLEWLQILGTEIQENVITGRNRDGSIPMTAPKISNLKKLKCFSLSGYNTEENLLLSNFSLVCTLIRLPSLESFSIGRHYVDEDEMVKFRQVMS